MLFGSIVSAVASLGKSWLENKKIKTQQKMMVQEAQLKAEIKRIEKSAEEVKGDINYDLEVLRNQRYSYKDEIALACVILPFIGNFIPGLQDYVLRGWEYLAKAPEWYSVVFIGAISASLGMRFLTKKMFK
jgi:hypothetical protein|tara:strand:- start:252 stop:644 length:393 start_codon:yes stop_codon:yes gene_type:complete